MLVVVDFLPEMKAHHGADINRETNQQGEGDRFESGVPHAVRNVADILQAKEPHRRRGTGTVHDSVGTAFDRLVESLRGVLLLLMRFTCPAGNEVGSAEVDNTSTDVDLGMIRDQSGRYTALNDILSSSVLMNCFSEWTPYTSPTLVCRLTAMTAAF